MDGDIAGEHEIPEDTHWGALDWGNWKQQVSSLGSVSFLVHQRNLWWLLFQFLSFFFFSYTLLYRNRKVDFDTP